MAFFPTSPVNGQQANVGNITYQWSNATSSWNRVGTTVTQLVDGITVNITGNLNATGTGQQTFAGRISSGGNITATGNIQGSHLTVNQTISAGGNIVTNGGLTVLGATANVVALNATSVDATSQISVGTATLTPTQLSVGNVSASNAVVSPYVSTTTLLASNAALTTATVTGNVNAGNVVGGNIFGSGGNITGNITLGNISATGNIDAVGNVSGTFILGNGFFLTGVQSGGGGGGTGSRANISTTIGPISNAVSVNADLAGYKGYALYKVTTSAASWVRLYTSNTARTNDSTRTIDVDPQPGAGVIAEIISSGANVVTVSPGAVGFNDDTPVSNNVPITITNISGSPATITVTLTMLPLES